MEAILATRNAHKVIELRRILRATGFVVDLTGLGDWPAAVPDVIEDGHTFAENAVLKARTAAEATGTIALADDSGICVDALSGMPGIFSARWCGRHGDDAANVDLLLNQIADIPEERRGAHFTCAAAAVFPGGRTLVAQGVVLGSLTRAPRGTGGFGYDPIFVPSGFERTTAEMTPDDKDAISHRGAAFRQLAAQLALAGRA